MHFRFLLSALLISSMGWSQSGSSCKTEIETLFQQKKFTDAEKKIRKCPDFETDTSLQVLYMRIQMSMGNFDTSLVLARRILSIDPRNQNAINACGSSHFMSESYDSARYYYDINRQIDSTFRHVYYNYAMLNNRLELFDQALADVRHFQLLYPDDPDGYILEGDIYADMGKEDTARQLYERVREKYPDYAKIYQVIAEWHFYHDEYETALKKIDQAILLDPMDDVSHYVKGQILYYMDDEHTKDAIRSLETSHKLKEDALTYYMLGSCYDYLDKPKKALEFYDKAIALDEDALFYDAKATLLMFENDYVNALDAINKAMELDTTDLYYWVLRARIHHKMGNEQKSFADYTTVLSKDSLYGDAYFYRALMFEDIDQADNAMADYTKAIAINPEDIEALFNRALLLTDQEDLDAAEADYSAILEIDETYADAYFNRALLHLADRDMRSFCADICNAAYHGHKGARKLCKKYCN